MAGERNEGGDEPEVLVPDSPDTPERAESPVHQDHADRQERPDRPDRPDHPEGPDSPGRLDPAAPADEPGRLDPADPLDPDVPGHPSGENAERFLALLPGEEGDEEGFGRVVDAVRWGEETLRRAGVRGARLQATLLVGHALDLDRAQVLANLREPVGPAGDARVRELIGRRAAHEPLQYLREKAPFLDFDVRVEPGVFIPRPETELVVERALELWRPLEPWRRDVGGRWAVDVGSGSGIIAIALALARPWGRVLAIDVSSKALAVARRNALRLGVLDRIVFVRGDLLAPLGAGPADDRPPAPARGRDRIVGWKRSRERDRPREGTRSNRADPAFLPLGALRRAVGIVVSNPPYAPEDSPDVHHEVREHEPREAWAAGPTGLEVYRRLIPQAAGLLLPGRPLVLELGYEQERSVPGLLAGDRRWGEPDVRPDFQGIPRVLTVRRSAGFQPVERGGRRQVVRDRREQVVGDGPQQVIRDGRRQDVRGGHQQAARGGREEPAREDDPPVAPGSPGPLS